MDISNELLKTKKVDFNKLRDFGFKKSGDFYFFQTEILNNSFILQIYIKLDGSMDTKVIEKETNEEYVLYKTNAHGEFVGKIREEIELVVTRIIEKCYSTEVFKSSKTKNVINYVREKYEDELEFLWEKFPDCAIWRRKDNKKWYGVLLTVKASKLGLPGEEYVEVLDLRYESENIEKIIDNNYIFAGYHMNKKHWITVLLNSSFSDEKIFSLIDKSYSLALK